MSRVVRCLLFVLVLVGPTSCASGDLPPAPPAASLRNPGFDVPGEDPSAPSGWGSQGSAYGTARVVERPGASGKVVELAPARGGSSGDKSFMLYQVLDVAAFRGRAVEFGARVATAGAGVNLVVWSPEGSGNDFVPDVEHADWMQRAQTFDVPPTASLLTFGIQVLGPADAKAWVDDVYVRLAGAPAPPSAKPALDAARPRAADAAAQVRILTGKVERTLPPTFFGMHIEWFEDASGLAIPGKGLPRGDVVALLRPLRIPLLRFPGGIAADFYDWRNGVGEARGALRNPFTNKRETVHFGSAEFVALARELNAGACITANYGTAGPAEAAAWASWFRNDGFTPEFWEVGNEIYLSGPKATGPNGREIYRPGTQYAKDFPAFVDAIKGVLPAAKVGAIAHLDTGAFPLADASNPDWTREMLSALTTKADFFALHNGYAPVVIDDSLDLGREADRRKMYRAMFAAPAQVGQNLAAVAAEIGRRSPMNAKTPFAITEFGVLIGISRDPKRHLAYVDHTRTQAAALYVASVLDTYVGDPRVFATMYTNPVHRYYGNLILADPRGLVTSPTYHLYRFFRDRFESHVVTTETVSPEVSSERVGLVQAMDRVPTLIARASRSADGRRLTVLLVNRSLDGSLETEVSLDGFRPARTGCEILAAPSPNAINGSGLTDTVVGHAGIRPREFPCKNLSSQVLSLPPASILSLVAEAS